MPTHEDPYKTLGIKRTADKAAIKRARRRKQAEVHPDKEGGTTEASAAVNFAYALLMDDDSRAYYDATGDAEMASDYDRTKASMMAGLFAGACQAADPTCTDFKAHVLTYLADKAKEIETLLNTARVQATRLAQVRERLTTDFRLALSALDVQVAAAEVEVNRIDLDLRIIKDVRELVGQSSYRFEAPTLEARLMQQQGARFGERRPGRFFV